MPGAENALQSLQGYQGIIQQGGIDLDKMFRSYTEMKKLNQEQQKLDEEKAYHKGYLDLTARMAGYRPVQQAPGAAPNPYAFEPDPDQLQQKQAQAAAEIVKSKTDIAKNIPHGLMTRLGSLLGDPQARAEMAAYQNALAGLPGGMAALPESGLPPQMLSMIGGPQAMALNIGNRISQSIGKRVSSGKVGKYSLVS